MRLWDYRLIPVLPKKMLVSQWRECVAIKRQWEKGTLKHRLVSYVMNYDRRYFMEYVNRVTGEMLNRDIVYSTKLYLEIKDFCNTHNNHWLLNYTYPEHNDRYLNQCLYNLQEKADRGIISEEEWNKIAYEFQFNLYIDDFINERFDNFKNKGRLIMNDE